MIDAVIRPTMTRAAQAAVLGGVCARAGDGAVSGNVMRSILSGSRVFAAVDEESDEAFSDSRGRLLRVLRLRFAPLRMNALVMTYKWKKSWKWCWLATPRCTILC